MAEDDERPAVETVGIGRLLAFSDGVFAIAFTILVLDLDVPDGLSAQALQAALVDQLPHIFSAVLSFAVIGRFWVAHHGLLAKVRDGDGLLLTINTALLAAVALIPFAASLLAEYASLPIATMSYSAVIALAALLQLVLWWWVGRRRLLVPGTSRTTVLNMTAGLIGATFAFLVAIPVALASTTVAQLCWLLALVPTGPVAAWWQARRG